MTNIVLLSLVLVTNSQHAIVGQANGKALLATQETVSQKISLGYLDHGKPVLIGDFLKVLSTLLTTNAVPIAMPAPPSSLPMPPTTNAPLVAVPNRGTNAYEVAYPGMNTNSPAYRHWLERKQRMRGTNGIPAK